jgi:hypothetical protein
MIPRWIWQSKVSPTEWESRLHLVLFAGCRSNPAKSSRDSILLAKLTLKMSANTMVWGERNRKTNKKMKPTS